VAEISSLIGSARHDLKNVDNVMGKIKGGLYKRIFEIKF